MRTFLFSCIFLSFLGSVAYADSESEKFFATGMSKLENGRFEEAYDSFLQAFRLDPGNLNYSFYLGRAAFAKGDYESAAMAYDRILIMDPGATRVKLELARCYLELGSRELAKQYFKEVLETNPPEAVWQNIQKFLASIEAAERRHFVNGIVSAGFQYDSNVRVAPIESTIPVPALNFAPFEVKPEEEDWALSTTAVINHIYKFSDSQYSWKSSAITYNSFHNSANDLDFNFLGLNTGPVRQTERYLWEAHALANYLDLGYDRYLGSYGFSSNLTLVFDQQLFFLLGLTAQEKNFFQTGAKDATNLTLNGGPILSLGKNRLSAIFARETENADDDRNSYNRTNFVFRFDRLLPSDLAFFASYRFDTTKYDQQDPSFLIRRWDELQEMAIGISKTLWWSENKNRSLAAQLSHTRSDNDSNIQLYEYKRDVTATVFTFAF